MKYLGVALALLFLGACSTAKKSGNDDAAVTPTVDAAVATADASVATPDASVPQPDAAVVPTGKTATGTVSGSVKASSPSYKLIGTVNSGTRNNKSTNYKKRGGVVGATQP